MPLSDRCKACASRRDEMGQHSSGGPSTLALTLVTAPLAVPAATMQIHNNVSPRQHFKPGSADGFKVGMSQAFFRALALASRQGGA